MDVWTVPTVNALVRALLAAIRHVGEILVRPDRLSAGRVGAPLQGQIRSERAS